MVHNKKKIADSLGLSFTMFENQLLKGLPNL
jgi:hypothetical protein